MIQNQQNDGTTIEVAAHRFLFAGDGPQALAQLLSLIAGATRELRLLYYIFERDRAGHAVRNALIEAVRRGVSVWLIIDGFGSRTEADGFFEALRKEGVKLCVFHPRFGRRYLLRNHQKMAIADDDRVAIGGYNISDEYFDRHHAEGWRDFGLEVVGPSVSHLVGYYDALFAWSNDRRASLRGIRRLIRGASQKEGAVRWLIGGPTLRPSEMVRTLHADLRQAHSVAMSMGYFAPNPAMLRHLGQAALRGFARVVTAAKSDNITTIGAARHCYRRLLKNGVEIFEYLPQKLHEKLIVIDDIGYVGSANFDMRSLYLNLEVMLRVEDESFAAAIRARIDENAACSERIDQQRYDELASLWRRLKWTFDYFLVAIVDFGIARGLNR